MSFTRKEQEAQAGLPLPLGERGARFQKIVTPSPHPSPPWGEGADRVCVVRTLQSR